MPEIKIYTQPGCPFCRRAVALLESKNIPFTEVNAPRGTAEREEAIALSGGQTTVPQTFVDGRPLGGCDDLMRLERTGQLNGILGLS
ncbi:glutaredoxin 3 [Acetobacter okinawensis]|uniref:Glutaredoxin n=1 Tax=Acetobacter okinawensis TaxID=1076594 RepID=A0A252BX46_9PROT|nr:glutaredoxin 3 [Acetobacter okinawensis]OUJ13402.1 glutaredoxin [Acetobacter okinawensis]